MDDCPKVNLHSSATTYSFLVLNKRQAISDIFVLCETHAQLDNPTYSFDRWVV